MMTVSTPLHELLAQLTLDQKVALVSGQNFWSTIPLPHIGLRSMVLSDGPSGVRGPVWDERSPSLSLPSGSALAASWDPDLAYRYGAVAAGEARRKGVDVVLGPTVNLHRSPLGGRHFEAFSEDPLLSGQLAAAYVRGLQDNGVAATPKHFVANDSETDRFTVDVRVSERVLRELYLLPFELAVEAGAWAIMAAYNSVNGITMTESALLDDPLNAEWGFDGVVVSDWTAVRSLAAAAAHIDLAMPGPATGWSSTLAAAIRDGSIDEEVLDRKILRLLQLAQRVGALDGSVAFDPVAVDGPAFAREAAVAGTVLLANRGELPWSTESIRSLAVIGQNAQSPRIQGGGSATVIPEPFSTPLDSVRDIFATSVVSYEPGAIITEGVEGFPLARTENPRIGGPGVRVTFLDDANTPIHVEDRESASLVWFDGDVPLASADTIVLETIFTPERDGEIVMGFASSRPGRLLIDGRVVLDGDGAVDGRDVALGLLAPPSLTARVVLNGDVAVAIRAEFGVRANDELPGATSATIGIAPTPREASVLIDEAVAIAREADVALVFVGTNETVESEGFDRTTLDLPGSQDDLVRAVAAVNPRTVVVVNAGSPVLLPWRDDVAAVIFAYFGGQGMGAAIGDILAGFAEPGGRLTTTWPALTSDVPVLDVTPAHGQLDYSEGLRIGYRAWLEAPQKPAYPFGWGLGYTRWVFDGASVTGSLAGGDVEVRVVVRNSGHRTGKQVVQVYAEMPGSVIDRPARWLVGSAIVSLDAGASALVAVPLLSRSFAHWDEAAGSWAMENGSFTLRIGTSVIDLVAAVSLEFPDSTARS